MNDLLRIVEDLNLEIAVDEMPFSYMSDGFSHMIVFGDLVLWSSDLEDRDWNDCTDDWAETIREVVLRNFLGFHRKVAKMAKKMGPCGYLLVFGETCLIPISKE